MSSQLIPSFHRTDQSWGFAGPVISNVGREKMMRPDMSKCVAALLLECVVFAFPHVAGAQGSAFAKLDFGGTISIEVPRNWTYQGENLRRHLNTAREAATRLAGITPNPGENVILVEAKEIVGDGRMNGNLTLRGDGLFDTSTGAFKALRNFGEELSFQPPDGGEREIETKRYSLAASRSGTKRSRTASGTNLIDRTTNR